MNNKFALKIIYGDCSDFLNQLLKLQFISDFGGNYIACNIVSEKYNLFYSSTTTDILRDAITKVGGVKHSPIRKNLQRLRSTQILTYDDITVENESDAIGMEIRRSLGLNSLSSYNYVINDYVFSLNITSSKQVDGKKLITEHYEEYKRLFLKSHALLLGALKTEGVFIND